MEHKDQHTVPRSYLQAWCDPNTPTCHIPYVWRFEKDGDGQRRKAPENIFTEREMYTLVGPDGARDLTLERSLAGIEEAFAKLRDTVLERRAPISSEGKFALCAFVGAMSTRTVGMRDHWRRQWQQTLDIGEEIERDIEKRRGFYPGLPPTGPTMSLDDVGVSSRIPCRI